jgi:hypothetical protein
MVKGGARTQAGGAPPLNSSELFTGLFLPTKLATPSSQQPRLPLKKIGLETETHSRKHRGDENWAAPQFHPPGWWYYGNSLTNWGQYWEIEGVTDGLHDYKKNQDYSADPQWTAVATDTGEHSAHRHSDTGPPGVDYHSSRRYGRGADSTDGFGHSSHRHGPGAGATDAADYSSGSFGPAAAATDDYGHSNHRHGYVTGATFAVAYSSR